jgi:peptidoglycan hydrolase-like protein with peptidoglycan-binding domain
MMRFVFLAVAIGAAVAGSVSADENARQVQEKLRDGGFYSGNIDGAYSSELSAALTRYQIRNGLPITGQLDEDTSKELSAKPAVTNNVGGPEQSSETWRRLRKGERRTSTSARRSDSAATEAREISSTRTEETTRAITETSARSAPADTASTESGTTQPTAAARTSSQTTGPAPAPPAITPTGNVSTERLRDFVAAFVLAGLDRNVGAEAEFFADRVEYYDQGIMDREKIREDLKRYDERWPERHFWITGTINIEPQNENGARVTFPLGFKLRNGNRVVTGKVDKTLVLEPVGDDLQIVAVNERKAD